MSSLETEERQKEIMILKKEEKKKKKKRKEEKNGLTLPLPFHQRESSDHRGNPCCCLGVDARIHPQWRYCSPPPQSYTQA
jgi:hypothetical protein